MKFIFALDQLVCCISLCCLVSAVHGQNVPAAINPINVTGTPPFSTMSGSREDVNLQNGNVHISVPLLSLKGRAGLDLNLNLLFDSKTVYLENTGDVDAGDMSAEWNFHEYPVPVGLGRLNLPTLFALHQLITESSGPNMTLYCTKNYIFTDWDGSQYSFGVQNNCVDFYIDTQGLLQQRVRSDLDYLTSPAEAYPYGFVDGSNISIDVSNSNDQIVYMPDGRQYHFSIANEGSIDGSEPGTIFTRIQDTNGNVITATPQDSTGIIVLTDTLQRQVRITSAGLETDAALLVDYKDSNGTGQEIRVDSIINNVTPATVAAGPCTTPGTSPIVASGSPALLTVSIPNSGDAPDRFLIGDDGLEVTSINYPAGGSTHYTFQNVLGYQALCTANIREIRMKQSFSDFSVPYSYTSSATETYTYTPALGPGVIYDTKDSGPNATMKVDNGIASQTNSFYLVGAAVPVLTNSQTTDNASGSVLQSIAYQYGSTTPLSQIAPSEIDTTTDGAVTAKVQMDYGSPWPSLVTEKREFDYNGSTVLRKTDYSYLSGSAYTAAHIVNKVQSVTVSGAAPNTSTTTYAYDSYSCPAQLLTGQTCLNGVVQSGAVQHSAPALGQLGNVTEKSEAGIKQFFYYDDAGNVVSSKDGLGISTGYGYTDAWNQSINNCLPSGGRASAYPTTISNALGMSVTATYNSCTGTIASILDQNSQRTSFTYDPTGRILSITDPDDQSGFPTVVNTYTVGVAQITSKYPSLGVTTWKIGDGLGRLAFSTAANQASVATVYNAQNLVSSVSSPYDVVSTVGGSGGVAYEYDGLGRKIQETEADGTDKRWTYYGNIVDSYDESNNHIQYTSDALGRLVKVMEEDPNPVASELLYETDYSYDALSNLVRVDQWGGSKLASIERLRTFTYDSLSRLVCAANPEISATSATSAAQCPGAYSTGQYTAGTIGYFYDNDNNVITKIIPQPNAVQGSTATTTISYTYDQLNRMVRKQFQNAPPGTLSSCFQYDTAMRGMGRLGYEWTQFGTCPQPTIAPSSGFQSERAYLSYDPMGRVTSETQCTPANCNSANPTPYSLGTMQYDLMGHLTQYLDGIGVRAFNSQYGVTAQLVGISSTQANIASTQLFKANVYTLFGAIQTMTLGEHISANWTYDARFRPLGESVNRLNH